jgi:magnesium transporter
VFKVLDLLPDGRTEESLDPARLALPPEGTVRWVEVIDAKLEDLELMGQRFGFHPLEIEDCATFELRSKIDTYPDHLFVVLHTFTADPEDPTDLQIHEVHAFIGEGYLVTVHDNPVPAADALWKRAKQDPSVLKRGPGWILYNTADAMVDAVFPMLEKITDHLEDIEEGLLAGEPGEMLEIFKIKRQLVGMRRVLRGVRDVVGALSRRTKAPMTKRIALYMRDVHDHAIRCAETVEEALALATNAMDTYQTALSNRTNEIIRRLTLFSVIFLPLGFLTGFWGQNFVDLPIRDHWSFVLSLVLMGATPVVLLLWFWRKRWL